jgi:hypothetical protein
MWNHINKNHRVWKCGAWNFIFVKNKRRCNAEKLIGKWLIHHQSIKLSTANLVFIANLNGKHYNSNTKHDRICPRKTSQVEQKIVHS